MKQYIKLSLVAVILDISLVLAASIDEPTNCRRATVDSVIDIEPDGVSDMPGSLICPMTSESSEEISHLFGDTTTLIITSLASCARTEKTPESFAVAVSRLAPRFKSLYDFDVSYDPKRDINRALILRYMYENMLVYLFHRVDLEKGEIYVTSSEKKIILR